MRQTERPLLGRFVEKLEMEERRNFPATFDGSLGAEFGDLTLAPWGRNILGERSYETFFPRQATGFRFDIGFPNKSASYGIELSTRF